MSYSPKELLVLIKENPISEKEVNDIRERLVKNSKEKDLSIPTKEFLERYYSL